MGWGGVRIKLEFTGNTWAKKSLQFKIESKDKTIIICFLKLKICNYN